MAKYRKKPIVIDAIQFTGNYTQVFDWVGQWHSEEDGPGMWEGAEKQPCPIKGCKTESHCSLTIDTLEGEMRAERGDWIIRGVKGEFYPCKPDIFKLTYELVD